MVRQMVANGSETRQVHELLARAFPG